METEKIIVSKEIKISNKLLSWVMGCECEFKEIVNNKIFFTPEHILKINTKVLSDYIEKCSNGESEINLHTFSTLPKLRLLSVGIMYRKML